MKPYYEDDFATIYHGDCLEVLRSLPGASVDVVLTDPPYCSGGYMEAQKNTKAQGLRGATVSADGFEWFADNMGTAGLTWLLREVMVQVRRLLYPNRAAFVFTDWRMVSTLGPAIESVGLRFRNQLIWDKGNAGLGVGFKPAYEVVMEFSKGSTTYAEKNGQNVLRFPRVPNVEKQHGAAKPLALLLEIGRSEGAGAPVHRHRGRGALLRDRRPKARPRGSGLRRRGMNVAQLRTILDHLPDDLPVMLPGGECWRVNRGAAHRGQAVWLAGAITTPGEVRLSGRFRDQRTLDVRLARLEAM